VHRGIFKSARVPLCSIAGAAVRGGEADAEVAGVARFDVAGAPRVELSLREPVVPRGVLGGLPPADRVLLSADEPGALIRALADRARRPRSSS
jgi:hypothetical protein